MHWTWKTLVRLVATAVLASALLASTPAHAAGPIDERYADIITRITRAFAPGSNATFYYTALKDSLSTRILVVTSNGTTDAFISGVGHRGGPGGPGEYIAKYGVQPVNPQFAKQVLHSYLLSAVTVPRTFQFFYIPQGVMDWYMCRFGCYESIDL